MTVFIVVVNDEISEVFDNRPAAENHLKNYLKKWSIGRIVERDVMSV